MGGALYAIISDMKEQKLTLCKATLPLLQEYYKEFVTDRDLFMDESLYYTYRYDPEKVKAYYLAKSKPDRVNLLLLLNGTPIGELALKGIDREKKECTLSVHLKNDSVKNRGYGAAGERMAVEYAFRKLGMEKVLANAVLKNARSQHVLKKVGFTETGRDDTFICYVLTKAAWEGLS